MIFFQNIYILLTSRNILKLEYDNYNEDDDTYTLIEEPYTISQIEIK